MPSKTDSNSRFLVPSASINDANRLRADYGDVDELARSIAEHGLLQPIVIKIDGTLIAGGRRLRAMRDILKWTEVPVTYFECADEATLRVLEVEENVRRKEMTWQERTLAIASIHQKHSINALLQSKKWLLSMTGELLGMSQASVTYALQVADRLIAGDKEINNCKQMSDAISVLVKRKGDEATALLAKMTLPRASTEAALKNLETAPLGDSFFTELGTAGPSSGGVSGLADDGEMPPEAGAVSTPAESSIEIPLSKMLIQGDSLAILRAMPDASVDHIITDWPYGIDMDNIQQAGGGKDVSSTAAEHGVDSNLALQTAIIPEIFRVLKPNGFFITWTDFANYQQNFVDCTTAGFKVQRWPLIWYKTSPCQNMAASYNFTKNYEIALVARKGNATLLGPQPSSVFVGGNDEEAKLLGHPFAKPFKLWEWLYTACVQRGQTVLDPFAGRGSAVLATLRYGASPIAIELNESHHSGLVVNVAEYYRRTLKNVKFT